MTKQEYNGWTNYETWNLALWIDNSKGSQEYWREQAEIAWHDSLPGDEAFSKKENAILSLSKALQEDTEENAPDLDNSFYGDILRAAISEVDFYQIAEHWIEEPEFEIQNKLETESSWKMD
jgi:hypothetical protein